MKEIASKIAIYGTIIAGAFVPVVPTEIQHAEWEKVDQIAEYNTSDGLLSDTQYANSEIEGIYYVKGEDGYPVSTTTLSRNHTEEIKPTGRSLYLNQYSKFLDESKYIVLTDDDEKYEYEKVKRSEKKEPNIKERESAIDLIFDPLPVKAYSFGGRSASQISVATQTTTFSHTQPSGFNVLVVRVANNDTSGDDTQSATFNSVSLTMETQVSTSTKEVSFWYLVNPDVGTYNIFVDLAPGTNSVDDALILAHSYGGVDTADVFNMTQSAEGYGTTTNILSGHVAGGYGIDTISTGDSTITVNDNRLYGSRISYFDAGSETFYTHDYFVNRSRAKTLSIASVEIAVTGIFWKSDGTKMYIVGSNDDLVEQFSCSTPRDVDTCTADGVTLNVNGQDTLPHDIWISPDGDRVFMIGDTSNNIFSYTCSTPWVISDANCTYDSIATSTALYEGAVRGVFATDDCTKVVFTGTSLDDATAYSMSTPCDLSTASFLTAFDVGSNPTAINITGDGYWINVVQPVTGEFKMHFCTTPWTFSTCVWSRYGVPKFESVSGDASGFFQFQDYKQFYIASPGTDTIYQFDYSSATTTTMMTLNNPSGNEVWLHLGGILNPATAGGTIYTPEDIIWFNEE